MVQRVGHVAEVGDSGGVEVKIGIILLGSYRNIKWTFTLFTDMDLWIDRQGKMVIYRGGVEIFVES